MSRIGRLPIDIPAGVTVSVDGQDVAVKGPKGELVLTVAKPIEVKVEEGQVLVTRPDDERESRSLHGLTRTLINNMVVGTTAGYEKKLEIVGVGYKAQAQGAGLVINVGYSHPVNFAAPAGITFDVPAPTKITVKGIDKQKVGQVAADIRAVRPPEPYKGKGIRYENEVVRRKEGKTGK